jgi:hypothetical protein
MVYSSAIKSGAKVAILVDKPTLHVAPMVKESVLTYGIEPPEVPETSV